MILHNVTSACLMQNYTWFAVVLVIVLRPHQVPVVGRAGALLGDSHTETGQAAIFVSLAEMKGTRFTAGARRALHIHLQRSIKIMRFKAIGPF